MQAFGGFIAATVLILSPQALRGQEVTQSFLLQPGWKAIWLEVQPSNHSPAAVFAELPLESVWSFRARITSAEFIAEPNEPVWNQSQWLAFFPSNRVESFDNNWFAILVNRPYLIRRSGRSASPDQ